MGVADETALEVSSSSQSSSPSSPELSPGVAVAEGAAEVVVSSSSSSSQSSSSSSPESSVGVVVGVAAAEELEGSSSSQSSSPLPELAGVEAGVALEVTATAVCGVLSPPPFWTLPAGAAVGEATEVAVLVTAWFVFAAGAAAASVETEGEAATCVVTAAGVPTGVAEAIAELEVSASQLSPLSSSSSIPAPRLIASRRTSWKSPPASHMLKPRRPMDLMNSPLAWNAGGSSNETMI